MTAPLSLEQTAHELGRTADWLQRCWPRLVADEGFPPPCVTRPYGWDPDHIQAWKDRGLSQELAKRVNALRGIAAWGTREEQQQSVLDMQRETLRKKFGIGA